MESFLIFSLILTVYGISSTRSEKLSDVQLMALFEKRINLEEFVSNIFNLPASEQLYVYEYLQDLIANLKEDPKSSKFFTAALKLLQQKTDDFNTQHKLQKVPVKTFLKKRIAVMRRTASKRAEKKSANESLANSVTKTNTGSKSNPKDLKTPPSKSERTNNANKSSPTKESDKQKKIAPQSEPEPVKLMLPAKEIPILSAKPVNTLKLPSLPNSKETKQNIQSTSSSTSASVSRLAKFESSTSTQSPKKSELEKKPSLKSKENVTKVGKLSPLKSTSQFSSVPVEKSPQGANETSSKSLVSKPTPNRTKSLPKSEPKPVEKPSPPSRKGTTSKAAPLNSKDLSQKIQTVLPPAGNQSKPKPLRREIKASKLDEIQPQNGKKSKRKLTERGNSAGSKPSRTSEAIAESSYSL